MRQTSIITKTKHFLSQNKNVNNEWTIAKSVNGEISMVRWTTISIRIVLRHFDSSTSCALAKIQDLCSCHLHSERKEHIYLRHYLDFEILYFIKADWTKVVQFQQITLLSVCPSCNLLALSAITFSNSGVWEDTWFSSSFLARLSFCFSKAFCSSDFWHRTFLPLKLER